MKDWREYKGKLAELRKHLEGYTPNPDVEVSLVLPDEEEFKHDRNIPYILLRYYTDEDRYHERKIELFDYYLEQDVKELINFLTATIEEFAMEIEQSEYGGG